MVLRIKEREEAIQLLAMDPQVCGKLLTLGEAMVLMQKPSVIESSSSRTPEKAPRWDLMGTKGCGGGKVVSWLPWKVLGYWRIYRQKKQVGGVTRGLQGWGARLPTLWPSLGFLDMHSKPFGCLLVLEKSSQKFHSAWSPFGISFLRNSKTRKKQKLALSSMLIGQSQKSCKIAYKCI